MRNYPERLHSSFNTTFNVLENLRIAAGHGIVGMQQLRDAEAPRNRAPARSRLYRSDKTGEVIADRFTHLTYPWHRHYTLLGHSTISA